MEATISLKTIIVTGSISVRRSFVAMNEFPQKTTARNIKAKIVSLFFKLSFSG
jgi:hypothetical protein